MKIAFLILAHQQIELVYKQINLLECKHHHFFIHLDKKYKPYIHDVIKEKPNVYFMEDRYQVNWGGFSIVQATLALINAAQMPEINFDYYVLMSGHCLPVKSKAEIRQFLQEHQGKSFMELKPLPDDALNDGGLDKFHYPVFFDQLAFLSKDHIKVGEKVYEYKKILFKWLKNILQTTGYKRKIPGELRPCFGSQWWVLHRKAVRYVLNYIKEKPDILNFFKYTWAPDELLFQTILYNSPGLNTIENRSLWYIDWDTNGPPKTLSFDDYEKISKSDALFARKFDIDKSSKIISNFRKLKYE